MFNTIVTRLWLGFALVLALTCAVAFAAYALARPFGEQQFAVRVSVISTPIAAALLSWSAALILSRSLSPTLTGLTQRSEEIAHGRFDGQPLSRPSLGELARLVDSFERVAGKYREAIGDETSRPQAAASEARAKAIFGAVADGLITTDERGIIESINPAAEKMFGYRSAEVVGRNVSQLTPSPHREEHDHYIQRYLRTGEGRIIGMGREVQGVRKDGTLFDIWIRVAELQHQDERIFIATIQDIGARRRTQSAIRDAVNRLAAAMQQILATTTEQAAGSAQQASTVTQTNQTAEQLRQVAEQAAVRADEMAAASRRTGEVGSAGQAAVEQSVEAMSEVKQQVEALARNILSLADRAQAISEITTTVKGIAEQTNVLALNAAVEASRAGEQGKGFAVVAAEVKSLAQQAKKATGQVRNLLNEIQEATHSAVRATEQGTRAVTRAGDVVAQAGETIRALTSTIQDSERAANQISGAASQQASRVSQLNEGMKSIDQVAQQNLLAIQQIEEAARNLNDLSEELAALTS